MRKNRVLAGLLAAVMLLGTVPAALAAETTENPPSNIQLDKTVASPTVDRETKLSQITLSVTAGEEANAEAPVAIEFVLDATQSMFLTTKEGKDIFTAWGEKIREQLADRNIYVGVTAFGRDAEVIMPMTMLTSDTNAPEVTIEKELEWAANVGTNLQAGIQLGMDQLSKSAAAKDDRYLVIVTDGGTYWRAAGNDTANGEYMQNLDAAEPLTYGYELISGGKLSEVEGIALEKVDHRDSMWNVVRPAEGMTLNVYTNFEKGVAGAYKEISKFEPDSTDAKLMTVGFPYYADRKELAPLTKLAGELIDAAAENSVYSNVLKAAPSTEIAIGKIVEDIAAAALTVRKGSVIVDTMGEGTDNRSQEYDFDLAVDQDITLTVNGKNYRGTRSDNTWTFGDGSKLEYTPETDGKADFFTFTLGQDLKLGDTMELKYSVKLVQAGAANVKHENLYTNISAVLNPAGSDDELEFPRPVVTYGVNSGSGPRPEIIPEEKIPLADLNTVDHYSYIIGYKDGNVMPYGTITRGEVATIFFRLLSDATRDQYWCQTNNYSDCDENLWCNNAISTLTNLGIIDGYTDGTFRPYAKITRAQFAKIAVGFFQTTKQDYKGYFYDVAEGAWYASYVEAAARISLIMGFEDGTFRPNTNITRAQACVIVNRAIDRKPDIDHLLDEDDMITWPDNDPSAWYYADIQEATNSHDYKWVAVDVEEAEDPTFPALEQWTAKLPQRDWAAFEHAWSTSHSAPGGEVKDISSKN